MDPKAIRLQASWQEGHSIFPSSWDGQNPAKLSGIWESRWWAAPDLPSPLSICLLSNLSAVPLGGMVGGKSLRSWTPSSSLS